MSATKKKNINLKPKKEKKNVFLNKETLLMRIGVIFLSLLILIFWASNLKNVWQIDNNGLGLEDIKEIIDEPVPGLDSSLEPIKDSSKDIKQLEEDTEKLLKDIMKESDKKATSTKTNSCPEWINCMPSIGEARSCTIPPGCEGITQIAY